MYSLLLISRTAAMASFLFSISMYVFSMASVRACISSSVNCFSSFLGASFLNAATSFSSSPQSPGLSEISASSARLRVFLSAKLRSSGIHISCSSARSSKSSTLTALTTECTTIAAFATECTAIAALATECTTLAALATECSCSLLLLIHVAVTTATASESHRSTLTVIVRLTTAHGKVTLGSPDCASKSVVTLGSALSESSFFVTVTTGGSKRVRSRSLSRSTETSCGRSSAGKGCSAVLACSRCLSRSAPPAEGFGCRRRFARVERREFFLTFTVTVLIPIHAVSLCLLVARAKDVIPLIRTTLGRLRWLLLFLLSRLSRDCRLLALYLLGLLTLFLRSLLVSLLGVLLRLFLGISSLGLKLQARSRVFSCVFSCCRGICGSRS
mmetsp:Transcript_1547/g.2694  ORF Transcript_1547/g.2694 Transcript_1547/m.2694 type:complete len:386 (-) Transcript_1547:992-2149(-)